MTTTESPVTATETAAPQLQPTIALLENVPQVQPMITLTEKAAGAVKRIIEEQQADGKAEKIFLRVSVKGGGCSGLQPKLDLDTKLDPKKDEMFELLGVPVVVDRRSQMYISRRHGRLPRRTQSQRLQHPEPQRQDDVRVRQLLLDVI